MTISQSGIREDTIPATEFPSFGEFHFENTEEFAVAPTVVDGVLEEPGFDIEDVWNNFCSTLDYI